VQGVAAARAKAAQVSLDPTEQRRIALRLGSALVGAGLLAVGWTYGRLQPDQLAVASLVQALAAVVVAWPVAIEAARGFLARPATCFTEQLVVLAILAAAVSGDFVTATLVPLLMEVGHLFEERSVLGARAAIEGIKKLHARRATRLADGQEQDVAPSELAEGDRVLVRPGEVLPADGRVLEGRSSLDQSPVTGESLYEDVGPGSPVFAGTVNLNGLLTVEVLGVGERTALGRVIELLRQAEASKAPITRLLERYASYYLPIVLVIAALVLFVSADVNRAIAVLVVSCPCALVLSGPAAIVAALAVAARWSVLIKGPGFLEQVSDVDTMMLDKTGTVTLGSLAVVELRPLRGVDSQELLRTAARCGYGSLHPVSRAVADEARSRDLELSPPEELLEEAGLGMVAKTEDGLLRLGRASWFRDLGLDVASRSSERGTVVWVARDEQVLGSVELADQPRQEARQALDDIRAMGVERVLLLTGDRQAVAASIAGELGFDGFEAEVLPERKAELVRAEQQAGRRVMMVGDGVNDALALHRADVGVAIGAVINEVALGGADVALMSNNLERLPQAMELARRTRRTINLNVTIGVGFSVFMLGLAAAGIISPLLGALLHNGGAIFVVINSARLLKMER